MTNTQAARRLVPLAAVAGLLALVAVKGYGSDATVWPRLTCQAALTQLMRDPDSLSVSNVTAEREDGGWAVEGRYQARNGFGGMNSDRFICVTEPGGLHPLVVTDEMLEQ